MDDQTIPRQPDMPIRVRHLLTFLAGLLVWLVVFGGIVAAIQAVAGAQVIPPQPNPITDYANYPANNQAPPGCDASGVFGVVFSVNGGAPVDNLGDIGPINAGDVLTMSWTGVSDVCGELVAGGPGPIVLAMKSAAGPTFDPTVDQALELPYAFGLMVAGQGGSVSYVLPNLLDDNFDGCFGQLDAVVGLPLAVVGPNGSFYGGDLRGGGPNLLISWWNGSYDLCEPPPTTTTTTTAPPEPTTTTTENAPTTPTTSAVVEVRASDGGGTPDANPPATPSPSVAPTSAAALPTTGAGNPAALLIAAGLLLVGVPCVAVTRRHMNRQLPR